MKKLLAFLSAMALLFLLSGCVTVTEGTVISKYHTPKWVEECQIQHTEYYYVEEKTSDAYTDDDGYYHPAVYEDVRHSRYYYTPGYRFHTEEWSITLRKFDKNDKPHQSSWYVSEEMYNAAVQGEQYTVDPKALDPYQPRRWEVEAYNVSAHDFDGYVKR